LFGTRVTGAEAAAQTWVGMLLLVNPSNIAEPLQAMSEFGSRIRNDGSWKKQRNARCCENRNYFETDHVESCIRETSHEPGKASQATVWMVSGRQIEVSPDCEKAVDSSHFNSDLLSNEIEWSNLQAKKQDEPRISTVLGMTSDSRDERENASDSIRFNIEPASNEIDESILQSEKQDEPRISTVLGRTID
jgi:hypothetical protein